MPAQGINQRDDFSPIGTVKCIDQAQYVPSVHTAQHLPHSGFLQLAVAKSNGLIRQAQGIAHGAPGGARQHPQSQGLCG